MVSHLFLVAFLVAFLSLAPGSSVAFVEVDFSTSIPHWTGQPFTATCTLGNYTQEGVLDYEVKFYRSVDSMPVLLGTHLVRAHNASREEHVFLPESAKDLYVHSGSNYSYPLFSIRVSPYVGANASNYWCAFQEIPNLTISPNTEPTQVSNVWLNIPQLTFTVTPNPSSRYYTKLSCSIAYFTPDGAAYSVEFRLRKNDNEEHLLGGFHAVKGRSVEFLQGDYQHVTVGQRVGLPTFELLANFPNEYEYWCQLIKWGTTSQARDQVTKSNVVR